jgi:3-methyladenine DNA glycosylase AlkD
MPASAREILQHLVEIGSPEDAEFAQRYFKTGPGQYGEGDRFLGIRAATMHKLSRTYLAIPLRTCQALLSSRYHEARLLAVLILALKSERGDDEVRAAVYDLYLRNTERVNNWDLVDASAPRVVGGYLADRDRAVLVRLARSRSLWERRIAIIATQHFIRRGEFDDTFRIADLLLEDREDLIQKATGWMLREVGNRDRAAEEAYLKPRYARMPRTMLRYAIEKFPEPRRRQYLKGEV